MILSNMILSIRTNDDVIQQVDSDDLMVSNLLTVLLPSVQEGEEIPLYNVSHDEFSKILEFTRHYQKDPMKTIMKPINNADLGVQAWYLEYVSSFPQEGETSLYDILMASTYLDIEPLQELICAYIASLLKGKECNELKKIFGLDYNL